MYYEKDTLDDLMHSVFEELLTKTDRKIISTKGDNFESVGNLLVLTNPLARLSKTETRGKAFSAIGELLWYLSRSNEFEFINYYIPDYKDFAENDEKGRKIIYGGYGPRLFEKNGNDQVKNVLDLLEKNPSTRKAVVQIYDAEDIVSKHEDVPCTCTLQFFIREERVHMQTSMRSNDAYLGLPHDIFAFTMLQEIVARSLHRDIGKYYHSVGSLHIYERDLPKIRQYLDEGWQGTKPFMPTMPDGDVWASIKTVLCFEKAIRTDSQIDIGSSSLEEYWKDIIRLLQIHTLFKNKDIRTILKVLPEIKNDIYINYVRDKIRKKDGWFK